MGASICAPTAPSHSIRTAATGALTADIRGYEEALEALAEARLIRREILPASRVMLNLLAKTSETDGRRVLTVPVNAHGGLYLGPIKLAELLVPQSAESSFCSTGLKLLA